MRPANLRRSQNGYALVIMLALLIAGSLYTLVDRLSLTAMRVARIKDSTDALKQAREALLAYAVTFRDRKPDYGFGYLPCPDMAGDDSPPFNMIGTGAGSCSNQHWNIGLLPYRTLGLPELRDGSGSCLWYAVSGTHIPTNHDKTALTPSTSGQLEVRDIAGNKLVAIAGGQRGAAAIVIAPGELLAHQDRARVDKSCGTDSGQAAAYLESSGASFVHGIGKNAAGETLSNDQMSWLTAKEIFDYASKRQDYNGNAPLPPSP